MARLSGPGDVWCRPDVIIHGNGRASSLFLPRGAVPSVNAKPRDAFAGLLRLVTWGDVDSPRYRDACRAVVTGFRVMLLEVSSIDLTSVFGFTLRLNLPVGTTVANSATTFAVGSGDPDQNNPQTWCRRWSPPVRFRCTRKRGAHNSEKQSWKPDQSFVREPIPIRITLALPVNAYFGLQSIAIATGICDELIWVTNTHIAVVGKFPVQIICG